MISLNSMRHANRNNTKINNNGVAVVVDVVVVEATPRVGTAVAIVIVTAGR